MAISSPTLDKGVAICLILKRRVDPALVTFASHTIPLDISQMRVHRLACYAKPCHMARPPLGVELHHPGLDDNPARAEAAGTIAPPFAPVPRQRGNDPSAAAALIEPAVSFPGSLARPRGATDSARIAAGLA